MAPKKSTIVLNVEQFIHDIEERPAIWNRNFHCNKAFLEQMWDELSAVYKLPKIVLKAKWKGLRDNFRVEYKRIPRADNGDFLVEPATFESKWIHYYALLFLTDHMRHRLPKNEQDQSFYFTQQSQDCEKTVVEPDLTNGLIRRMQDSDEDFDEDDMAEDDYDDEMTDASPPPQATVPPPSALPPPPPLTPQLPQQLQQQQQLQPPPRQLTPPAAHQSLSTVSASLKPDDAQTLLKAGLLRAHQAALLELEKEAQDLSKKSTTYAAAGVAATSTPIKDIATTTTPLMMTTTTVTPNTTPPPMLSATSCSNSSSSTALMMATTTNSTVAATLSQLISNCNNNNNNAGQSAVALSATQTPVQLTTTPTPPTAAHKKRSVSPPPLYNKAHHPPPNVGNQASAVVHSVHCKERDDYPLNGNAGNVNNVSGGGVGGVVSAVTCLHGSHEHLNFTKHSYANGLIPALKLKRQRLSEDSNFNGSSTMDTTTAAPLVPEDDDYHYLLSLHPYMKQLTAAQKLRIRTKIQKLIFKELYKEDLEETK